MGTDVTVLRVFTDSNGEFGNPLGVVDARQVPVAGRQRLATRLGYSETVFVDIPDSGSGAAHASIYTPRTELAFAGHPVVGAAWWLRENGWPINTVQVPAGVVQVGSRAGLEGASTVISARAEWAPEFAIHDFDSVDQLLAADPADYPDDASHYLWAWADRCAGSLRSRMFAANIGVAEDEATGSDAMRITDYLSRDLRITQGKGSVIETTWNAEGWVGVAGRVVNDGLRQLG